MSRSPLLVSEIMSTISPVNFLPINLELIGTLSPIFDFMRCIPIGVLLLPALFPTPFSELDIE